MFTGIIEELGTVRGLDRVGASSNLQVLAPLISQCAQPGQSICVNGACLTVTGKRNNLLEFEVMQETLQRTNLGLLKKQDKVNLERALKADGRIDGHFLSGHIDTVGVISRRENKDGSLVIEVEADPEQVARYIVLKGSVALDGISLTVSKQGRGGFKVSIISYTLKNTTLGMKSIGDRINIEWDLLGKYLEKALARNTHPATSTLSASFLSRHGFTV